MNFVRKLKGSDPFAKLRIVGCDTLAAKDEMGPGAPIYCERGSSYKILMVFLRIETCDQPHQRNIRREPQFLPHGKPRVRIRLKQLKIKAVRNDHKLVRGVAHLDM